MPSVIFSSKYPTGEWKQFVRQRGNEILRTTRKEGCAHCPGEQNPADIGSRLKENELWRRGPAWLSGPKEGWPVSEISETPQSVDEERKVNVAVAGVKTHSGISTVNKLSKFSRLQRLLRLTSWVKRFRYNLRSTAKGTERRKGMLSGSEIAEAG